MWRVGHSLARAGDWRSAKGRHFSNGRSRAHHHHHRGMRIQNLASTEPGKDQRLYATQDDSPGLGHRDLRECHWNGIPCVSSTDLKAAQAWVNK